MSGFFTTPASQRKRRRPGAALSDPQAKKRLSSVNRKPATSRDTSNLDDKNIPSDDESISGSDSALSGAASPTPSNNGDTASDDSDALETAAERRLKLAERYLDNIRAEVGQERDVGFDAEEVDRDLIAARLKEDVAEDSGRLYRYIARGLDYSACSRAFFRADTLATFGVAACPPYLYTASKDIRLIKWQLPPSLPSLKSTPSLQRRRKPKQILYTRGNKNLSGDPSYHHHTASILCIAASYDGKYVVTGGADRRLIVWDASNLKPLKMFTQHRDAVTGLVFRGKTNQLFSSSKDRTVKIWSLDSLAYVETLFGHQDEVVDISAVGGSQERCISVGARDRTARLWKVVEESQLVFRGGGAVKSYISASSSLKSADTTISSVGFAEGSLDRVIQIDTQLFVTGSDSGALSLFSLHKKKPLHVVPIAHGFDPALSPEQLSAEADTKHVDVNAQPTPRWITALKAIPFSDLFVSGSWDGVVRIWRITTGAEEDTESKVKGQRRIEPVAVLGSGQDELDVPLADENLMRDVASKNEDNPTDGHPPANMNESSEWRQTKGNLHDHSNERRATIGVINDLTVFERGERGRDGVCIVAAIGTEPRLGRWMKFKGKNGAMILELPRLASSTRDSS